MKSEEEIYNEIISYINGVNHRRSCTLATIKKVLRTQKIVDLIFSRPDIFKLDSEIKHVPIENLTDEVLVRYVLAIPWEFPSIDESLVTLPVMVAFAFAKRRYEEISAYEWGPDGEVLPITEKFEACRASILDICSQLPSKYNDEDILNDYLPYIEKMSKEIMEYCSHIPDEIPKRTGVQNLDCMQNMEDSAVKKIGHL